MQLDRLADRFTERLSDEVDKVRDRTAEAVSADGASVLKELAKVQRGVDRVEDTLIGRLDAVGETLGDLDGQLDGLHAEAQGTSWPRRLFWLALGIAAGLGIGYLTDPDRGRARRDEIANQATSRAREVKDEVVTRAEDVKDQAAASASRVVDQAKDAAEDVAAEAQQAAEDVRDQAQESAQHVVDEAQGNSPT